VAGKHGLRLPRTCVASTLRSTTLWPSLARSRRRSNAMRMQEDMTPMNVCLHRCRVSASHNLSRRGRLGSPYAGLGYNLVILKRAR
jgi:hypothetical protein